MRSAILGSTAVALAGALAFAAPRLQDRTTFPINADNIAGVVRSANGPEAGVWVIAETSDLPTGFRKIVVTDERGRYLVPDLPRATYRVWVRGYGLVDSPSVTAAPGRIVNLKAVMAPNARAAAEIYPAVYWFSMLKVPPASDFPGGKNGIAPGMKSQADWVNNMKSGCIQCHQLGTKSTREMAALFANVSSVTAWDRRVQISQVGATMTGA